MSESEVAKLFDGYNLAATAFNTGFFAFNTGIIDDRTQAELKRIADKYLELGRFPEQLCMNLFFYGKWTRLPIVYNLFACYLLIINGMSKKQLDGVVLHFPRCGDKEGFRCWEKSNAFYDEWTRNLQRAELIHFGRTQEPERQRRGPIRFLFQMWRFRFVLLNDYLWRCRTKMSVRSRIRRFVSSLKAH
jgi:lipopolysaccharide biosynthesis glycosyltransferase